MRQAAMIAPPHLALTLKVLALIRNSMMIRVRCIQIECQKIQPDCILDDHQMRQECKHLGMVYITRSKNIRNVRKVALLLLYW